MKNNPTTTEERVMTRHRWVHILKALSRALGEATLLFCALFFLSRFHAHPSLTLYDLALPPLAWLAVSLGLGLWPKGAKASLPCAAAVALLTLLTLRGGFVPALAWGEIILALATPWVPTVLRRINPRAFGVTDYEAFGWALLFLATGYLYESIAHTVVHGTGDARWYAIMMQDTLLQTREGIFPLFGGQTEYQFNGVLYPIRIAPGIHYLVAAADFVTGQQLEVSSVLNFALVGWAFVAAGAAFIAVRLVRPDTELLAFPLALFFVACPGVMSVVYNTDLYMSWVTVPGLPLAWYACLRMREQVTLRQGVLLSASLGLLWWGHTPIAVWTTLLVAAAIVVPVVKQVRLCPALLYTLGATAVLFVFAAGFPLAAALLYPAEPNSNVGGFQVATPPTILYFLREAFPKVWLPINPDLRELSTFQLGYVLWAGVVALMVGAWRRRRGLLTPVLIVVGLLLLLHPHPMAETLWSWVPGFVRNTTGNWPMNRLYLIAAGLIVVALPLLLPERKRSLMTTLVLALGVTLAAGWSIREGRKFSVLSDRLRPSETVNARYLALESINITRFAYLVMGKIPAYFSHGYFDPLMEHRLLDENGKLILSNEKAVLAASEAGDSRVRKSGPYSFAPWEPNPAIWQLNEELKLEPGKHYLLSIDLPNTQSMVGILQLDGERIFLEAQFPVFGEPKSYGTPEGARTLSIRPRGTKADSIKVKMIVPTAEYIPQLKTTQVWLLEYDPALLPFQVTSWLPYTVEVNVPQAGWLETPRSYQTHWRAEPSDRALRRSSEALVEVAVPEGASTVSLRYHVPVSYYLIFWISALTVILGILFAWLVPLPKPEPELESNGTK